MELKLKKTVQVHSSIESMLDSTPAVTSTARTYIPPIDVRPQALIDLENEELNNDIFAARLTMNKKKSEDKKREMASRLSSLNS